jgi:hypothetical protein
MEDLCSFLIADNCSDIVLFEGKEVVKNLASNIASSACTLATIKAASTCNENLETHDEVLNVM